MESEMELGLKEQIVLGEQYIKQKLYRRAKPILTNVQAKAIAAGNQNIADAANRRLVVCYIKEGNHLKDEGLFYQAGLKFKVAKHLIIRYEESFSHYEAAYHVRVLNKELELLSTYTIEQKLNILCDSAKRWHERGNSLVITNENTGVMQGLFYWKYALDKYVRVRHAAKHASSDNFDYSTFAQRHIFDICKAAANWAQKINMPELGVPFENIMASDSTA